MEERLDAQTVSLHHCRLAIYDLVTDMWLCRDNKSVLDDFEYF